MSSNIHQTAIISDEAVIGDNVEIGPYSIIGAGVRLANDVKLHSHVVVDGDTDIGEGTQIFPFASIGTAPQDLKFAGEKSKLIIGKNNKIREHSTMNPGTKDGDMETTVGDNCLFMMATHVAHDCHVGNNVIMANNATLGGHVHVGNFAVIGGLSAVHQFIRIGDYAVIGGMSGVESDVIPFGRVKGERAFLAGLNLIGMERHGFEKSDIKNIQKAVNLMFDEDGTLDQRLAKLSESYVDDSQVMSIIEFAKNKTRFPLCQPPKK